MNIPEESKKIRPQINTFKFGKYIFFDLKDEETYSQPNTNRCGFVIPFDINRLSKITQNNIKKFQEYGFVFDKMIYSPTYQGIKFVKDPQHPGEYLEDPQHPGEYLKIPRVVYSIYITGIDYDDDEIVYARRESRGRAAGQTLLYWKDFYRQMTKFLEAIPIEIKIKDAEKRGDNKILPELYTTLF